MAHVGIRVTDPAEPRRKQWRVFLRWKDKLVFMDIEIDSNEHVYP